MQLTPEGTGRTYEGKCRTAERFECQSHAQTHIYHKFESGTEGHAVFVAFLYFEYMYQYPVL